VAVDDSGGQTPNPRGLATAYGVHFPAMPNFTFHGKILTKY